MSTKSAAGATPAVDYGDWAITLILTGVMAAAFVLSTNWPAGAAFFPELLAGTGLFLCLLNLASLVWQAMAPRTPEVRATPAGPSNGDVTLVEGDEEQGNEDEFHKIFMRADWRMWGGTIGWLVLFFAGMSLFGLLVTLPLFTIAYLRLVSKVSWTVCLLYVLGTAGLMYCLFVLFLHLPLPQGMFPIIGD